MESTRLGMTRVPAGSAYRALEEICATELSLGPPVQAGLWSMCRIGITTSPLFAKVRVGLRASRWGRPRADKTNRSKIDGGLYVFPVIPTPSC